jgi:hypothetical protein
MPRRSAASMAVVPLMMKPKPEPPVELTEEQAVEWRAVVDRMPADWFARETHALLSQYCRHVVRARRLAGLVDGFKPEWAVDPEGLARFDKLLAMAARETAALTSVMTRLRLTQQSRYTPSRAGSEAAKPGGRAPWERVK